MITEDVQNLLGKRKNHRGKVDEETGKNGAFCESAYGAGGSTGRSRLLL